MFIDRIVFFSINMKKQEEKKLAERSFCYTSSRSCVFISLEIMMMMRMNIIDQMCRLGYVDQMDNSAHHFNLSDLS